MNEQIIKFLIENFEPYKQASKKLLDDFVSFYINNDLIALCLNNKNEIKACGLARKLTQIDHDDIYQNFWKHRENGDICVVELLVSYNSEDTLYLFDQMIDRLYPFKEIVFIRQLVDGGKRIHKLPADFVLRNKKLITKLIGSK